MRVTNPRLWGTVLHSEKFQDVRVNFKKSTHNNLVTVACSFRCLYFVYLWSDEELRLDL